MAALLSDLDSYPELGAWAALALEQARRQQPPPQQPQQPTFFAQQPMQYQQPPAQQMPRALIEKRNFADVDADRDPGAKRVRPAPNQ